MEPQITEGDLVVVYWHDTEDSCSWREIDEIRRMKPPLAKSAGWFLSEDESCVRILSAIVGEEAGRSVIPKCSIKRIEKVRDDELDVEV